MFERNKNYLGKKITEEKVKRELTEGAIELSIRSARRGALVCRLILCICYVAFCLFTLHFIIENIFFGGFYSSAHGLAIAFLIVSAVLLILGIVAFFAVWRIFYRTGLHLVRILLSIAALVIASVSMIILGPTGYLVIAGLVLLTAVAFEAVLWIRSAEGFSTLSHIILAVFVAVAITVSSLFTFGAVNISPKGEYVELSAYERNVRYESFGEGGAKISKVMLTAADAFRIKYADVYEVEDIVPINGVEVPVVAVGAYAFREVGSFDNVSLPATVRLIEDGAFINSAVKTLTVSSENIDFGSSLKDSGIREIIITSQGICTVNITELPEGTVIRVPRDLLDEYRANNPTHSRAFVPIIAEDELYVTFDILPDAEKTDTEDGYLKTYIEKKDKDGNITVELPYASLVTENESYGKHWQRVNNDGSFRLLALNAGGKAIGAAHKTLTVSECTAVSGQWQRVHFVYADASALGGGERVMLGELSLLGESYTLPEEYLFDGIDGYVCRSFHDNAALVGGVISKITDTARDLVVYPRFELLPPTVLAEDYEAVYDGQTHTQSVSFTHPADVSLSYISWKKDGDSYYISGDKTALTVSDVADSGVYEVTLTVEDKDGRFASATKEITVSINPKRVKVTALPRASVYGEEMAELTYTHSGLIGSDTLTGELACDISAGAGEYDIGLGTLTAGENYHILLMSAKYTVTKASYDMSGVSFVGGSSVYDGLSHIPYIDEATLPVGLDGIRVSVDYVGDGINAGTREVKAVFATASKNYNIPSEMTTTITIDKADAVINTSGVLTTYVYTGALQTVNSGATLNHSETTLVYSDNTFTTVAEGNGKTVTITATETANYKSATATVELTVEKATAVIDTAGVERNYVYTGAPQTVNSGATLNHSETTLVYSDNTFTTVAEGNGKTVTITATETDNYKSATATVELTVEKATAVIDTAGVERNYVYTGAPQTVNSGATLNHTETTLVYSNNTFTNVPAGGEQVVTITSAETANYKSASVTVTIYVEKATAVINTTGVETNYTYTGALQTVNSGATLNHTETTLVYSNNSFTNVPASGEQVVTITSAETANYKSATTTVTIYVEKATAVINTTGVETNYTYTGALQTVNSGATLNHTETTLVYSDNTFTTVAEGNGKTVTITATETDNYKSASATVTVRVSPMKVALPTVTDTELTYTGELLVFLAEDSSSLYTVTDGSATEVGDYVALLALKDTENYVWADGGFDGRIEWRIV